MALSCLIVNRYSYLNIYYTLDICLFNAMIFILFFKQNILPLVFKKAHRLQCYVFRRDCATIEATLSHNTRSERSLNGFIKFKQFGLVFNINKWFGLVSRPRNRTEPRPLLLTTFDIVGRRLFPMKTKKDYPHQRLSQDLWNELIC